MAKVLAGIEKDDDGTTGVPSRQRKRRLVEDDPEPFSTVPEGVEKNPMAPTKRQKKDETQRSSYIPPLPLQPVHPDQIPPQRHPKSTSQHQPQLKAKATQLPVQHRDDRGGFETLNAWNDDDRYSFVADDKEYGSFGYEDAEDRSSDIYSPRQKERLFFGDQYQSRSPILRAEGCISFVYFLNFT